MSSGLVPLLGDRAVNTRLATVIDVLTVFALVGGVAGSLGYGILQLGKGVELVFGITPNTMLYIAIGVAICIAYTATSISGLQRGILWLGDKNAWFFLFLLAYLLLCGPAAYIFNLFTQSTGSYLGNFIESMTYTAPFPNGELWPQWWDMYWWVNCCPTGGHGLVLCAPRLRPHPASVRGGQLAHALHIRPGVVLHIRRDGAARPVL